MPAAKNKTTYYESTVTLDEIDLDHIEAVVEKLRELGHPCLQITVRWEVGPGGTFEDLYELGRQLGDLEADLSGYMTMGFEIPKPKEVT